MTAVIPHLSVTYTWRWAMSLSIVTSCLTCRKRLWLLNTMLSRMSKDTCCIEASVGLALTKLAIWEERKRSGKVIENVARVRWKNIKWQRERAAYTAPSLWRQTRGSPRKLSHDPSVPWSPSVCGSWSHYSWMTHTIKKCICIFAPTYTHTAFKWTACVESLQSFSYWF